MAENSAESSPGSMLGKTVLGLVEGMESIIGIEGGVGTVAKSIAGIMDGFFSLVT